MALDYTTVGLLSEIRRRARLDNADADFTDAALLAEADTQLSEVFVPLIMRTRSDYYLRHEDQTLVTDQQTYAIPYRAVASAVRQVCWIDSTGSETELQPVPPTETSQWATLSGTPVYYAVRDDELVILPKPNAAIGTLRVWYEYRPAKLVGSGYFTVTAVTDADVTVNGSVTWTAASRFDFIKAKPPFTLLQADAAPTGADTDTVVPFADLGDRVSVGDYLCLPGESPVPQIPAELVSALALAVVAEVLLQYSPDESVIRISQLEKVLSEWGGILAPRHRGRSIKVVNRSSAMRRSRTSRRSSNLGP